MTPQGLKTGALTPAAMKRSGTLAAALERFDWFYIGAEFCENLLPRPEELLRTAGFFLQKGKNVCVLTPMISDRGLKTLEKTFRLLRRCGRGLELTVNDFGALRLARDCGLDCPVSAGRLLYENLFRMEGGTLQLTSAAALRFFARQGVRRFEIPSPGRKPRSNFGAAARLGFKPADFSLTLYYPWLNVTSARTCLLGTPDIPPHVSAPGIRCRRECGISSFEVRHPLIKQPLTVSGNTVFLHFPEKFHSSEKDLAALRVDRLVYCPRP